MRQQMNYRSEEDWYFHYRNIAQRGLMGNVMILMTQPEMVQGVSTDIGPLRHNAEVSYG